MRTTFKEQRELVIDLVFRRLGDQYRAQGFDVTIRLEEDIAALTVERQDGDFLSSFAAIYSLDVDTPTRVRFLPQAIAESRLLRAPSHGQLILIDDITVEAIEESVRKLAALSGFGKI